MKIFLSCSALIFCFTLLSPSGSSSQWLQTNGPYGGSILSMASSDSTLYAGTYLGGVYRSRDNGKSWEQIGPEEKHMITSMAVNGSDVYAVSINDYYAGFIYKYSGTGSAWSQVSWNLPEGTLFTMVKMIGSKMFVATYFGLYWSADNGTHWTKADSGLVDHACQVNDIAAGGGYVFAATDGGIYRSADGGITWSASNASLSQTKTIAVVGTDVFASGSQAGVWRSSDWGSTWTTFKSGMENSFVEALASINDTLFAGTGSGVYRSIDRGEHWIFAGEGLRGLTVGALVVKGSDLFAGTSGGGVFFSADKGSSWTPSSTGMINTFITAVWAKDSVVVAGLRSSGIIRSADEGATWSLVEPSHALAYEFAQCGTDLFMHADTVLYHSSDNGKTWTDADTAIKGYALLCLTASDSLLVVGSNGCVLISADHGKTWSASDLGVEKISVTSVAVMDKKIFAGTQQGIYLSTDGGLHWEKITSLTMIQALAVQGTDLFADSFVHGVYRVYQSASGAWTSSSQGISEIYAFAAAGSKLFVGRRFNVCYYSPDRQRWSWMPFDLDKTLTSMWATDRYLFAGTEGGGIYKMEISRVLGVEGKEYAEVPEGFRLGQNFPNPFNPSTRIAIDVPERGFVRLTVFDVMGREVARLVDGELGAGRYEREWNAAGRASGVYYYRLQAGGRVETKKMMMVK